MEISDPSKALRDIHLPEPISWWPLAIGWYVAFAITLMLTAIITVWLYRHIKLRRKKQKILQEFYIITHRYRSSNTQNIVGELSVFLRRFVFAFYPRANMTALQGKAWLTLLDQVSNSHDFSQGIGQMLLTAPYQAHAPTETQALVNLIEKMIKNYKPKKRKSS